MTLLLSEEDVRALLPMKAAIPLAGSLFLALGLGRASCHPRRRHKVPDGLLHIMDAAWPDGGVMGLKAYTTFRDGARFHVLLYSSRDGRLLAILEADWLGRIRTGAMSAVATDWMAREDAAVLGVIGTGRQARTQLEAMAHVRRLREVRCFSRGREGCEAFAREMAPLVGVEVRPVQSAQQAVAGADIVVTATWAREPVLRGEWMDDGTHVNAIGSNHPARRELDDAAVHRAGTIAVDHLETAKIESGDLLQAGVDWSRVRELGSLVAGCTAWRRSPKEVTLFKSHGIALLDVGTAAFVVGRARETGRGRTL